MELAKKLSEVTIGMDAYDQLCDSVKHLKTCDDDTAYEYMENYCPSYLFKENNINKMYKEIMCSMNDNCECCWYDFLKHADNLLDSIR